jgi:hypothetical protein
VTTATLPRRSRFILSLASFFDVLKLDGYSMVRFSASS